MKNDYYRRVVARTFAKVESCGAFLSIVSRALNKDPQALLEIGMGVVLDKPIYLLVRRGDPVPENLRRLARAVEEFDSPEDLEFATKRLMARAVADGHITRPPE
jgi:hypothetical protein